VLEQAKGGSPLTDSNRRPPPYHGTSQATGRNPRQRFWLDFAVPGGAAFATACRQLQPRGSIRVPSFLPHLTTARCNPHVWMVDPEFVAVGAETQARLTDLGVMRKPGGEGEQAKP